MHNPLATFDSRDYMPEMNKYLLLTLGTKTESFSSVTFLLYWYTVVGKDRK